MALLEISRRVLWSCNERFSASVSQLNWPWVDVRLGAAAFRDVLEYLLEYESPARFAWGSL